jgi:ADP-heptose:LPS heptosyltransferase
MVNAICEGLRPAARSLVGRLSLKHLAAVLRGVDLMITVDSGPMHIAAALGTRVLALFGPTDPARNGPWSPEDMCVSRHGVCECFHLRRCRAARWCLDDVQPGEVAAAVERRLDAVTSRPRAGSPPTSQLGHLPSHPPPTSNLGT